MTERRKERARLFAELDRAVNTWRFAMPVDREAEGDIVRAVADAISIHDTETTKLARDEVQHEGPRTNSTPEKGT